MEFSASRGALLVGLTVIQVVFFVSFAATYPSPAHPQYYPGATELAGHDDLVGKEVTLTGRLVNVSPVTLSTGSERYTLRGVTGVCEGSRLEVYGVVGGDGVRALSYVEHTRWGLNYAYVASFVAGLWVLARLVRDWRVGNSGLGREGDA